MEDAKQTTAAASAGSSPKTVYKSRHSFEDILRLDGEGSKILFDPGPEFVELTEGELRKLSQATRTRYTVTRELHEDGVGQPRSEDEELLDLLEVGANAMGAASRLQVTGYKGEGKLYFARPDQLSALGRYGARIHRASGTKTVNNPRGEGSHKIQSAGETELVLVEIPKNGVEAMQAKRRDLQLRAEGAPLENAEREGRERGLPLKRMKGSFEDRKVKFRDIGDDDSDD